MESARVHTHTSDVTHLYHTAMIYAWAANCSLTSPLSGNSYTVFTTHGLITSWFLGKTFFLFSLRLFLKASDTELTVSFKRASVAQTVCAQNRNEWKPQSTTSRPSVCLKKPPQQNVSTCWIVSKLLPEAGRKASVSPALKQHLPLWNSVIMSWI